MTGTITPNLGLWGTGTSPLYTNKLTETQLIITGNTTTGAIRRLDGNDRMREEPFGRLAHLAAFNSHRYRIHTQGQALDQRGKTLARSTATCLLELIPVNTGANLRYNIKITPLP
jgi:hypothetical protein